jgi:hypothetical protein
LPSINLKSSVLNLSESEKNKLNEIFRHELDGQKEIIVAEIKTDREHLRLVNFSVTPFLYNGTIASETGYLFVRVEPLLKLGIKNFDVAIYNKDSKVVVLVECKSSIARREQEVDHVVSAAQAMIGNKKHLEDLLGDSINTIETVICTNAAYVSKIREYISDNDLPITVWLADQGTNKLLLEKQGKDTQVEITRGRCPHDGKFARLLIDGVRSTGVRAIPFLPSSHPCTLLEEVTPLLHLAMEKMSLDRFRLSDLHTVLKVEGSLLNLADDELWKLSELVVKEGLSPEIFRDCNSSAPLLKEKMFELTVRKASVRSMTEDVRSKYVEYISTKRAEEISLRRFQETRFEGTKKLEEF